MMSYRKTIPTLTALFLFAAFGLAGAVAAEEHPGHEEQASTAVTPAAQAFARLKSLDGNWTSTTASEAAEPMQSPQTFRVSSAGSVVMEIMGPGTEHEMINMYHLDGDELVMKHYCASGNQPEMRLAEVSNDGNTLHFAFAGGTNLDPAVDDHIHEATLTFADDDTVKETWIGYHAGERASAMELVLTRSE